jgi:transcriptional regulator with XRE-family HTH domain
MSHQIDSCRVHIRIPALPARRDTGCPNLGQSIRNARIRADGRRWVREHGMSQAELARKAGLSRPALALIEAGKRGITRPALLAIEKVLGVTFPTVTERRSAHHCLPTCRQREVGFNCRLPFDDGNEDRARAGPKPSHKDAPWRPF